MPAALALAITLVFQTATHAQELFSEEPCPNVCMARVNEGLFSCQQDCAGPDDTPLPTGIDFLVKKMREALFPPIIEKTVFDPATPSAGIPLNVSLFPVKRANPDDFKDWKVKFIYSFDGTADWTGAVPQLDFESKIWKTSVDIPADAAEMRWLVRAGDAESNTYIEIPCAPDKPAPGAEDCFFPMSGDDTYTDVPGFSIDPALDITESWFAADERRYYFRIKTVGGISDGKLLNSNYNYYLVGAFDPGRPPESDSYHKSFFIMYSPHYFTAATCSRFRNDTWTTGLENDRSGAPCAIEPCPTEEKTEEEKDKFRIPARRETDARTGYCIADGCALIIRYGMYWTYDSNSVICEKKDNELFVSVQRKVLPKPAAGAFVAWIATGVHLDLESSIITDYTPTTAIRAPENPQRAQVK